MTRIGIRLLALILIALAAVIGWQGYRIRQEKRDREAAELQAGLDASRVVSDRFTAAARLEVARRHGSIQSRGACVSGFVFADEQRTVAPYSVAYQVDLAGVDRASYRWDAADRVMFVEVPDVTVEPPNIDMAQARSEQTGMVVSRACGIAMQRQVAGQLRDTAADWARRPDHLAEARGAARAAVAALLHAPLAAAGHGDVTVRVRLASDPRPRDDRQWDVSRSIAEVLADPILRP